tara:strand:- start:275 stop:457 length:183 start_codon:yes stop_codon:yes gene_type:complete
MRTQNKENQYYLFWIVAMIAFIAPQVMTAFAYHKLADMLTKPLPVLEVEIVETSRMNIDL